MLFCIYPAFMVFVHIVLLNRIFLHMTLFKIFCSVRLQNDTVNAAGNITFSKQRSQKTYSNNSGSLANLTPLVTLQTILDKYVFLD